MSFSVRRATRYYLAGRRFLLLIPADELGQGRHTLIVRDAESSSAPLGSTTSTSAINQAKSHYVTRHALRRSSYLWSLRGVFCFAATHPL